MPELKIVKGGQSVRCSWCGQVVGFLVSAGFLTLLRGFRPPTNPGAPYAFGKHAQERWERTMREAHQPGPQGAAARRRLAEGNGAVTNPTPAKGVDMGTDEGWTVEPAPGERVKCPTCKRVSVVPEIQNVRSGAA